MEQMNKNNISVIIRTKNEERWIGHTIQSVLDQIYKPEIIVVDDYSTDNTINVIKSFRENVSLKKKNSSKNNYTAIKIFNIDDYSPGRALNYGVKKASREFILIISAHCVLNKISLNNHIKDLKKNVCVFGNQIPLWNGRRINKRYIWSHFINKRVKNMYSKLEKRYFLHNALAIYKKSFLKKNKFDENLVGKEDRYWANQVISRRKNILYDPSLEANHHYTPHGNTWRGLG